MDSQRRTWRSDLLTGFLVYCITTLPVGIGLVAAGTPNLLESCCHYDGEHFIHLVDREYWYEPERASGVAFFPGYPLLARGVVAVTGFSSRIALLLVSNLALIAALTFLSAYLRPQPKARLTTLLLVGLWPVGLCFRMAYSESLFLAAIALLMLGLSRRWPIVLLALIAGAGTGIRAVGLAASATVLVSVLMDQSRGPLRQRLLTAVAIAPVACWGLLAFMLFQFAEFETPLAFLQTQRHWSAYVPEHPEPIYKVGRLAIAEPIWGSYVPGSTRHWTRFNENPNPLLGTAFWNPILFVFAGLLVAYGWHRRWLSREESILGFGLLVIPYVTRSDEQSMISHARFAAVVLPAYIVLGQLLSRTPLFVRCIAFAGLATLLALWTALFAAGGPLL